jgi:hypothetical protein
VTERADLYFSADIEADGPIPGPYSMLSFGLAVAGRFDGKVFEVCNPEGQTFYRELRPISNEFDPKALQVSHLDRDALLQGGEDPTKAMTDATDWVRKHTGEDRAVVVAFPASFDWLFLYWYFVSFSRRDSPFDFSSCLDLKTAYQQRAGVVMDAAGLSRLPPELRSGRPHTHNALDDAVQQAEIFQRLWPWHPDLDRA